MKVVKSLIILVSVLLFISHGVAQEKQKAQLWQTTANTALKAEPTSSSETVSYLKQGTIVEEIKQNKEWIKVKTPSGQIGWISKALVQPATDERLSTCKGVETFSALCPIEIKDTQKKAEELKVTSPFSQSIKGLPTQKPGSSQDSKVVTEDMGKVKPVEGSEGSVAGEKEQEQTKEQTKGVTKSGAFITSAPEFSAESFAGSSYVVEPETVTAVKMSSSDVNRIVCPVDIKDVVYSDEKGIQVKISGKNAFVKFLIKKLGGKEIYSNIPADLYVVCGDNVFSIIAFPERIPSVTVYLEDKKGKIKEILEKKQMPLEKEIVEYVKAFILGKPPVEAEGKPVKRQYNLYEHLAIQELAEYNIEGKGLTVRVFTVQAQLPKDKPYIDFTEKAFLRAEITQAPLAVSLDKLRLRPGEKARLIIIERTQKEVQ